MTIVLSTDLHRFRAKLQRSPGGCWNWIGARKPTGYGNFWYAGKTVLAHRFAWEALVGPIPDGLTVDHICRNTSCVNPAHMEIVPFAVNLLRGECPPAANARKTHCPQGHQYGGDNLHITRGGRRHCRTCKRDRARAAYRIAHGLESA